MAEPPLFTKEEWAQVKAEGRAHLESRSREELLAMVEQSRKENIPRNSKGQFRKGAPSPNPRGRPPRKASPREFTMTQTARDLLELFEQPVNVRLGKRTVREPAIVAIYRRLIKRAVDDDDWQAIKKCVELRERYSDFRGETVYRLFNAAQELRASYRTEGQEMSDELTKFVEMVEAQAVEGQFSAG